MSKQFENVLDIHVKSSRSERGSMETCERKLVQNYVSNNGYSIVGETGTRYEEWILAAKSSQDGKHD
jgi:hypothetical protein